jgi:hypothetical protein
MKYTRHLLAIAAMIFGLIAPIGIAVAQAVAPPQSESFPQTYGEWGARWWQYVFGIPADENPISDTTGKQCHVGQWGPVFFLAGANGGTFTRSCDVAEGVGLFLPIINIGWAIPDDGDTPKDIVKVCSDAIDKVDLKSLFLIIDHKTVQNLEKFRASQSFSFTGAVPNVDAVGGCTFTDPHCYEGFRNTAFQDGYWAMLRPLSVGQHVFRLGGRCRVSASNLT